MDPTVAASFEYMSNASPIIVSGFLLMTSIFNQDIKAFVWMGALIIGLIIVRLVQPLIGQKSKCPSLPMMPYTSPSASSFLIMFTLAYLVAPMHANGDYNVYAILGFLLLFGVDAVVKLGKTCVTVMGVVAGTLIGVVYGIVAYSVIKGAGGNKLLYYDVGSSNNVYCSKPKKQTFKCNVYKNGELISTI
jgi:hypothetical protein